MRTPAEIEAKLDDLLGQAQALSARVDALKANPNPAPTSHDLIELSFKNGAIEGAARALWWVVEGAG